MGATFSVFTPPASNSNSMKQNYVFSYRHMSNSGRRKSADASHAARTMLAQHLSFNASALKKLISSGTLGRSRKNVKPRIIVEELVRKIEVEKIPPCITVMCAADADVDNKENVEIAAAETEIPVLPVREELLPAPKGVKRTVLQASTSELLRCLGIFLHGRFKHLSADFAPHDPMLWLRTLDRSLIAQGWQDIGFINPANIVFLYLLLRDLRMESAKSVRQLQAQILTAFYLSYSYMGHEISYPVKLFLHADDHKDDFWKRCLRLIDLHSENMLQLNSDAGFFAKIFAELKSFGSLKPIQYIT